jgi:hypothetical protein
MSQRCLREPDKGQRVCPLARSGRLELLSLDARHFKSSFTVVVDYRIDAGRLDNLSGPERITPVLAPSLLPLAH